MRCVIKSSNAVSENSKRFQIKSCVDGSSGVISRGKNKAMRAKNYLNLYDFKCESERSRIFSNTIKIAVAIRRGKNTIQFYSNQKRVKIS